MALTDPNGRSAQCSNCVYGVVVKGSNTRTSISKTICKRYPPGVMPFIPNRDGPPTPIAWGTPIMSSDNHCGEHPDIKSGLAYIKSGKSNITEARC